jgi:hypothetical protein
MKQKRFTTSKIVLSVPWIMSAAILGLVTWAVITNKAVTQITALSSIYAATVAIAGYSVKWYMKKAALENEPKVRLGVIAETIELARSNPDLKIYDTVQVKADIQAVTSPIKADEENQYKNIISEDVGIKIT